MELKHDDMLKLEKAFFNNCKRPFGNSDVSGDILEIIGAEPEGEDGDPECWSDAQRKYAHAMYDGLIDWLKSRHA